MKTFLVYKIKNSLTWSVRTRVCAPAWMSRPVLLLLAYPTNTRVWLEVKAVRHRCWRINQELSADWSAVLAFWGNFGSKCNKTRHLVILGVYIQQLWTSQNRNTCTKRHIFLDKQQQQCKYLREYIDWSCVQWITATVNCFRVCGVNNIITSSKANTGSQKT